MSSYIVKNKTINRFLTGFTYGQLTDLEDMFGFDNNVKEWGTTDVGKKLMRMNCKAVSVRYGEKIDTYPVKTYEYENIKVSKEQQLQSLACYLYQCSEGNVPKTKLYKFLEGAKLKLMWELINEIPAYKKAEWG